VPTTSPPTAPHSRPQHQRRRHIPPPSPRPFPRQCLSPRSCPCPCPHLPPNSRLLFAVPRLRRAHSITAAAIFTPSTMSASVPTPVPVKVSFLTPRTRAHCLLCQARVNPTPPLPPQLPPPLFFAVGRVHGCHHSATVSAFVSVFASASSIFCARLRAAYTTAVLIVANTLAPSSTSAPSPATVSTCCSTHPCAYFFPLQRPSLCPCPLQILPASLISTQPQVHPRLLVCPSSARFGACASIHIRISVHNRSRCCCLTGATSLQDSHGEPLWRTQLDTNSGRRWFSGC
jgi:hypothetical protein